MMKPVKKVFSAMWQRQLGIPGFGPEAQQALAGSHALILGVGGVGCPAALYLAAAGLGSMTLVDGDVVEAGNLNRQILYGYSDVGRPKVEAAAETLRKLNPGIKLEIFNVHAGDPEIESLVAGAGVVVDCFDRNRHRLSVNKACLRRRKAAVHSYVQNFSGYVIFSPGVGGCLNCLVDESFPEQGDNSVIGVAAGQAGIISAAEAIRHLTGIGGPAGSRQIFFDLAFMEWTTRPIVREPLCPACGKGDTL
ncbi:MAG: HesA/MoeB/ThiF family protein [Bacillota bacterium]